MRYRDSGTGEPLDYEQDGPSDWTSCPICGWHDVTVDEDGREYIVADCEWARRQNGEDAETETDAA